MPSQMTDSHNVSRETVPKTGSNMTKYELWILDTNEISAVEIKTQKN